MIEAEGAADTSLDAPPTSDAESVTSVAPPAPTVEGSSAPIDPIRAIRQAGFADDIAELEKLLSQSNRAFLLGAGCSKCAGLPLMAELTSKVLLALNDGPAHAVLEGLQTHFTGATSATIEDYMSELVDLLAIAERRHVRSASQTDITIGDSLLTVDEARTVLRQIKQAIAKTLTQEPVTTTMHCRFVRAIHGTLQSGKSGPSFPVDYFTLNYDTLIEDALGLERIRLADGFNGGATGWWSIDGYDAEHVQARVLKVHGSIDWCGDDILPRRVRPTIADHEPTEEVLIWPAATKYREAQRDPYAQIMMRMRSALRPVDGREAVLTIVGYSFSDAHINLELERALRESGGRLTVVALSEEREPRGELKRWIEDPEVGEQVRVYADGGVFHGRERRTTSSSLKWWQFEVLARVIGGER